MSRHPGPTPAPLRADQRNDLFQLQQAILTADRTVPCTADLRWISEHDSDQASAAWRCRCCPVIDRCREYINRYPTESGVYAGLTETDRKDDDNEQHDSS